ARVALGVLVLQDRTLALEHRHGREVLGGDHLERPLLALELARQHFGDLGIDLGQRAVEEVRRQLDAHRARRYTASATITARSRWLQLTPASKPAAASQSSCS